MSRVISWLQKLHNLKSLTTFLVGLTFFVTTAIVQLGYVLEAQAAPVNLSSVNTEQAKEKASQAGGGVVESIKDTADTLREKLNLDEPLPDSTKTFFKQVQGEDVKVEEPLPSGKGETPNNA